MYRKLMDKVNSKLQGRSNRTEPAKIMGHIEELPQDGRLKLHAFYLSSGFPVLVSVPEQVDNEDQLMSVIKSARENHQIVRVVGSAHSIGPAIGDIQHTENERLIRLGGDFRSFTVLSEEGDAKIVKIGGGCYLGKSPLDQSSTWEDSVNVQLANINCAIPILGGITKQTMAGFMMTGSAGGSVAHGFEDIIKEIHFVDGKGEKQVAKENTDLFNAVGVSLGLFGIITYVVIKVNTPSFNVAGVEKTVSVAESVLAVNENTGKSSLQETLQNTEYFRLLWYPQKYAQRVTQWSGQRSKLSDIIPYQSPEGKPVVAGAASMALRSMNWLLYTVPGEDTYKFIGDTLKIFTVESQSFNDVWYKTMPMDDQIPADTYFKIEFTELWFPIEQSDNVLKILRNLYEDQLAAGNNACEIYAGKSSPFWLSPAYGRDVVRIDPFWFHHNLKGNARDYFDNYWKALLGVEGIRLHWGKYLPYSGGTYGSTKYDLDFLRKSYPKLDAWLALRNECDPDQIFVTQYWRKIFDIETKASAEAGLTASD